MTLKDCTTISHLEQFLEGSQAFAYAVLSNKDERYQWIQKTLVKFRYNTLKKRGKGVVIRYLMKISGYSRQQLTRLIKQYVKTGRICRRKPVNPQRFTHTYTRDDIRLLAKTDTIHGHPCGAVLKKICARHFDIFGETKYERLSSISVSHIYNLRATVSYRLHHTHYHKTQPKVSVIGERRRPNPQGVPGYLRVDTVHQGDQDKIKGVYHINMVDIETQFEIVCTVEKISEAYLITAIKSMMAILPFEIRGFHSDNGSEYINSKVAQLLEKLRVEFTKSRPRHSNDNGLVESKNASVVRKHFGYSHIPQQWANAINEALQMPLYVYQNFHCPVHFPTTIIDEKGKERRRYLYENMMTPYEKLISLPNVETYLREGVTLASLAEMANQMTDNEAAEVLNRAKHKIFTQIFSSTG